MSQTSGHQIEDLFFVDLAYRARVGRLDLVGENLQPGYRVRPRLLAENHRVLSKIRVRILSSLTDPDHALENSTRTIPQDPASQNMARRIRRLMRMVCNNIQPFRIR